MKRTTYILIGLFVAGLCVLVGGMFMIFCLGRPFINQLNLQGEQLTKEVPACRVILLTQTKMYTKGSNVWLANSLLEVQPSKDGKNLLSCSKKVNDYLKITVMGDTLKILLDYPQDQLPQEFKESKFVGINIGDMRLDMTQDVECIINDIDSQKIGFKHLKKDSLSIDTSNSIVVDSCDFAALQVIRSGRNVDFQSGTINNLYLNLGMMDNWFVNAEKCHIGTEYLTAHYANVQLQKGECERMIWIPEKNDSKLNVSLAGKACVTVME
ncbi:hypothetical protein AB9N12_09380 [Bacteroides sp. AN502(2024)]|uniref:hypothetical protein n=1 Tax=Bacteroides sp. AN502(2024) TaxID=3160599 RepID=UPI003513C9FE